MASDSDRNRKILNYRPYINFYIATEGLLHDPPEVLKNEFTTAALTPTLDLPGAWSLILNRSYQLPGSTFCGFLF